MRKHYRVMLGKGSKYAPTCFAEGFIGTDYEIDFDLTGRLPDHWQAFNREFIPIYQQVLPGKSKIGAGLAMGALWTVSKGIRSGDVVLCPTGDGAVRVGEVTGEYLFVESGELMHRRPVRWFERQIDYSEMSETMRRSLVSQGTVVYMSRHAEEIERLLAGSAIQTQPTPGAILAGESLDDLVSFAMEKHLEDFLVANWSQTELGRDYEIFQEDGEVTGQQYQTDTGPIDILAISRDKKRLLVVELKRGRASDAVVGQVLRYMGYVMDELAEDGQSVHGAIIALEDDQRLRRALAATTGIKFFRYQVSFKLQQA